MDKKRVRNLLAVFFLTFGTSIWFIPASHAEQTGPATITCAKEDGTQRTANVGWDNSQRALSNNSVAYSRKPEMEQFIAEWKNLYDSKSGERGIYNVAAAQAQAAKYGRRDPEVHYGTNPCSEIILRPYQIGDRVWYNGSVYSCIANNDGINPSNPAYWTLVAVGYRLRQTPVDWNATTGDYQILNKPTIPAAQVNSDWNAVSGVAQILNKPTLAAVATSGDYNDLINQPSIPSNLDDLADVNAPTPSNGQVLSYNGSQWVNSTPATGGTVTSIGLSMPSAFNVANSPVTTAGTLTVTGAGTTDQYVRGDGTLANFPATGGGGGQVFYFNGNISQGTIGGNDYYELGTAANTGPAANFTRATTGAIARFITDVGEPNHLLIPSGVWSIDVYLSETGGGSNNAEIVAKLYTYNGSTFTLVATSPLEQITNGNVPDLYTFSISVPNTVTAATDRDSQEYINGVEDTVREVYKMLNEWDINVDELN